MNLGESIVKPSVIMRAIVRGPLYPIISMIGHNVKKHIINNLLPFDQGHNCRQIESDIREAAAFYKAAASLGPSFGLRRESTDT